MDIDEAIIIITLKNDDNIYQVALESEKVKDLLRFQSQFLPKGIIPIREKPIKGLILEKIVNNESTVG